MSNKGVPFIHTENLWFSYSEDEDTERVPIIRGISVDIEEGAFVAVLGHNGSGKSTFAKLLNMILTPDSGKICIDGRDITRRRAYRRGYHGAAPGHWNGIPEPR